jgi:hypothetical protein
MSLAPMLVMVPYMIYVFRNRFESDYQRRDELIALKAEKERMKNVNSKDAPLGVISSSTFGGKITSFTGEDLGGK